MFTAVIVPACHSEGACARGNPYPNICKGDRKMKATGIVRRVDDLGRIVIPKEIRRTLKIREGDPSYTTFISSDLFIRGILAFGDRVLGDKH